MKFLHIADLHIGRRLGNISMMEDQKRMLDQVVEMAKDCDAVLIAGDIYNRAQPTGEAVRMAGGFLAQLNRMGKPVFVIAGNHDGGEMVDYCGDILERNGVHASGVYDGNIQRHVLADEFGPVHVYLMPFIKPIHVKNALKDVDRNTIHTYEDAMKAALDRVEIDPDARNVLVAHQYVSGAEMCESEERVIGGLDQISLDVFEKFDYVALGHLHSPQRLRGGSVCYSGSPLKYSLSEEKQKKGALMVEIGKKGDVKTEVRPFYPLRDVRTVEGNLADIAAAEKYSEDFVAAIVTDEIVPADPMGALRTVYPNMIFMRVVNSRTNLEIRMEDIQIDEDKDELAHFIDFYTMQNNQTPPDAKRLEIMKEIIMQAKEKVYEAD